MTSILITGATGFVGSHLVNSLVKKNYEITVLIRDKKRASKFSWFSKVKSVIFDIHKDNLEELFFDYDSLIHLAWQGLPNYNELFHYEENLPYNYFFIKKAINDGVKKILVTGTCFEFGMKNGQLSPDEPTEPNNSYALAKDVLRKQLEILKNYKNFKLKWARLFYMFGKRQNSKSFFQLLSRALERGDKSFDMSGGEQIRDYLPIEEVNSQIIDIFESENEGCFNVCSGQPISLKEFAKKIIADSGKNITLNLGHYPYTDSEPMAFWGEKLK